MKDLIVTLAYVLHIGVAAALNGWALRQVFSWRDEIKWPLVLMAAGSGAFLRSTSYLWWGLT